MALQSPLTLDYRELDAALGLTETANDYIHESRTGRNVQHRLLPLLRQSVYSRLAGYEDTNDAERLAQDQHDPRVHSTCRSGFVHVWVIAHNQ